MLGAAAAPPVNGFPDLSGLVVRGGTGFGYETCSSAAGDALHFCVAGSSGAAAFPSTQPIVLCVPASCDEAVLRARQCPPPLIRHDCLRVSVPRGFGAVACGCHWPLHLRASCVRRSRETRRAVSTPPGVFHEFRYFVP